MTYKGYVFRQTLAGPAGFPGDGPNDTWVDPTLAYVSVASGGAGYGWTGGTPGLANVGQWVNTGSDPRLWGQTGLNGSSPQFRVDVPNGTYDIMIALGNSGTGPFVSNARFYYGAGTYFDVTTTPTGYDRTYSIDAMSNAWSNAAWPASNVVRRVTVTQGYIQFNKLSSYSDVRYLAYQKVAAPYADLTLKDDTNAVGTTPQLYEAEVDNKVVAYFNPAIGDDTDTTYTLTEADGVTPNQYLGFRTIGTNKAICIKPGAPRFPGDNSTYTFKLIQTNKVAGAYPNSPYAQTVTLNVTAAPTKPHNDGSLESMLSSACFLAAKGTRDIFQQPWNHTTMVGEWQGYTGGTINASTTVYSTNDLNNAINTYKANAAISNNMTYCIEIDSNGGSDWDTTEYVYGFANWDFYPENGNVLLIRMKQGGNYPILRGGWFLGYARGVHALGIIWGMDFGVTQPGGAAMRCYNAIQFYPGGTRGQILKVEKCLVGLCFRPGNETMNPDTINTSTLPGGFNTGTNSVWGEQFIAKDCIFWGIGVAFSAFGHRMTHLSNIDVSLIHDDCIATSTINPTFASNLPDLNQYEWFDGVHVRSVVNSNVEGIHADINQQRTFNYAGSQVTHRLFENSSCSLNFTDTNIQRNVMIVTDTLNLSAVFINNLFINNGLRGIDTGCGTGISYAEFNTLGYPAIMPPTATTTAQIIYSATGGVVKQRRNIYAGAGGEDNIGYQVQTGAKTWPYMSEVMNGPFIVDPGNSGRYAAASIPEAPLTVPLNTHLKSIYDTFKSLTPGYGVQYMKLRLKPGESDTLTLNQAETLTLSVHGLPSGTSVPNAVTLRWSQSGVAKGINVDLEVS